MGDISLLLGYSKDECEEKDSSALDTNDGGEISGVNKISDYECVDNNILGALSPTQELVCE